MESLKPKERTRCYGCHRPRDRCFCHRIPEIGNRTKVLIVQHARERFHPFNTARILKRALLNSRLMVDSISRLATQLSDTEFLERVALLYPGPDARLLDEIPETSRPQQLVVLDGTWHHTKTLVRDIPLLQRLPRIRLAPTQPSRYKIRREPNAQYLSTLEATVAALRYLEPETMGLENIVAAFERMIEDQISLPMAGYGWRRNHRRRPSLTNIPRAIQERLENIVVVYGETEPGAIKDRTKTGEKLPSGSPTRMPVYWVAERMVSGERFESAVVSPSVLPSTFLDHLELSESDFRSAMSIDEFRSAWIQFLRPDDVIAFYYSNIAKLLIAIGGPAHAKVRLKSVQLTANRNSRSLEQILVDLNVPTPPIECNGRAGKRLASTIAYVSHLHQIGNDRLAVGH